MYNTEICILKNNLNGFNITMFMIYHFFFTELNPQIQIN